MPPLRRPASLSLKRSMSNFEVGLLASSFNCAWVNSPQDADVTDALGDTEVGVECKCLR
jgi:hypothetical protein